MSGVAVRRAATSAAHREQRAPCPAPPRPPPPVVPFPQAGRLRGRLDAIAGSTCKAQEAQQEAQQAERAWGQEERRTATYGTRHSATPSCPTYGRDFLRLLAADGPHKLLHYGQVLLLAGLDVEEGEGGCRAGSWMHGAGRKGGSAGRVGSGAGRRAGAGGGGSTAGRGGTSKGAAGRAGSGRAASWGAQEPGHTPPGCPPLRTARQAGSRERRLPPGWLPRIRLGMGLSHTWSGSLISTYFSGMAALATHCISAYGRLSTM
jgi:hypothetical protein